MLLNLGDFREDYNRDELLESQAEKDPFQQFARWFKTAVQAEIPEPNAMVLATSTTSGRPSARVVLLKEVESESFVFYTNYESRKGQEMAENPHAALVFNWLELHRQIRVEGLIEKVPATMSTEYFQSRPKGSQIGAWASPQSQVIPRREILEEQVRELNAEYSDAEKLPRPEHWGGYRLRPHTVEFWQGRTSRLHDRLLYTLAGPGAWVISRLAP
ncbi:pyridoxamine 5'-phosphate oxidase [Flavilitoribacter nigricans]|uniref:Pyridoxine/pyridoxamine 5'-phosphate oxidase n=1 Tax=Flavilitoribacter nigricans (strain ATCC 23147 / DSM 23189 / NBRC 102662 / NCIMB 1420 / SS-2) TaxID=1122177 RepID=A0A2D0N096_FLAN2|nr:pyridoxamine 5'-phosphate oxidase [Flavilitoribacter nigricans]PHN01905.1 pyridoxamine 5'-phosphate oxidase [Flavilitoribacter nigricans DSM 23189 = NBRC 102662]